MSYELDNLTITLLFVLAALLIYHRFFSLPTPLVHPLLLGKQSDVSSIRKKYETGMYRSFATGQGSPFTVRPANTLKTVNDITHHPLASTEAIPRCILDVELTEEALSEIVRLLPIGLRALFPSISSDSSSPTPLLALIPPSPATVLPLLLLQLSSHPSAPLITLSSPAYLTAAIAPTGHPAPVVVVVHVDLFDDVVEQVWEDTRGKAGVLIVGDPSRTKEGVARSIQSKGLQVRFWEEIWEEAEKAEKVPELRDPIYSDVHSYFYAEIPNSAEPVVVRVTNMNVTAGIAGVLSLFPADKRPTGTAMDVVASSVRLDSPFGMTVALASIWSGAGFRFIGPSTPAWPSSEHASNPAAELAALMDKAKNQPDPTVLFLSSAHHFALVKALQSAFVSRPLASFAASHKLVSLAGGDISRKGWWEGLVWGPLRESVLGGLAGDRLRAVAVVGDTPPAASITLSHILLSLPFSRVHSSSLSAGPVFNSHYNDVQSRGIDRQDLFNLNLLDGLYQAPEDVNPVKAHTGPPSSNIEVVLKGEGIEEQIEAEKTKLVGAVWIRGPGVLERVDKPSVDGWVYTGDEAAVQTNGTFIVDKWIGSHYELA